MVGGRREGLWHCRPGTGLSWGSGLSREVLGGGEGGGGGGLKGGGRGGGFGRNLPPPSVPLWSPKIFEA